MAVTLTPKAKRNQSILLSLNRDAVTFRGVKNAGANRNCTTVGGAPATARHASRVSGARRAIPSASRWVLLCLLWVATFGALPSGRADAFTLSNLWSVFIGTKGDSSPALSPDGTLYFGAWDGRLRAITTNGAKKWFFQADLEIRSSPAIGADGTIYFGSRDRKFYAITPAGKEKWHFKTGAWVDSSPALGANGSIYFGSWDSNFYALHANGTQQWSFATGGHVVSSPAVGLDGTIYFGSHDKKFYALRPDGTKRWEWVTQGQIVSSPALNGEECVYFSSVDGGLYAVNLDGRLRWRLHTGGTTESSPVIGADGTIYVGVNDYLWGVSAEGKKKWQRTGDDLIESAPLLFANGELCFMSRVGLLMTLDPLHPNLTLKWTHYFFGHGYASWTVGPDAVLYVPSYEFAGALCALPVGSKLANTPWPKFRANLRNTGNARDNTP
jgi:outer membrane protein assembly factor BamB